MVDQEIKGQNGIKKRKNSWKTRTMKTIEGTKNKK